MKTGTQIEDPVDSLTLLKQANAPKHARVEKQKWLVEPHKQLDPYRDELVRVQALSMALELRLPAYAHDLPPDWPERRKPPELLRDLRILGFSEGAITAVDPCARLPLLFSSSAALGSAYVLEGATPRGQVIALHPQQGLCLTPFRGVAFSAGYGAKVSVYWQPRRGHVASGLRTQREISDAVEAAAGTFEAFESRVGGGPKV